MFHRRLVAPGQLAPAIPLDTSVVLHGLPGFQLLDSLAVDDDGWVNVGTLINGGVTSISPDGSTVEFLPTEDPMTTNLCFGGENLRTAFITLSGTGRLVATKWPRAGLRLAHQ